MSFNRRLNRTLLLLALVAFAAHAMALIGVLPGNLPSTGDTSGAFVPWHQFIRHSLWSRGEIPLWNPHVYCGIPFLGNGQSGLLYPPNYLHFLLPENLALWLFAFGHSFFLMAGSYFLGRTLGLRRRSAFLIAVLFGLGNANPAHLFGGHLTFLPARSYWPWEAAFLIRLLRGQGRGNAAGLAACVALGLAAGAPQIWLFGLLFCIAIFVVWLFTSAKWQWRRASIPLVLAGTLALLWCAPTLLPLRELRDWSSHGDTLTFEQVSQFGATPRSLFRLLFNGFFGGNSSVMWSLDSNAGEDAASIGFAALVVALVAPLLVQGRRVVTWLYGGSALALVLAVGSGTPLYSFLYDHVVLFQVTRVPARWLELWAFGAALLSGYALEALLTAPERGRMLQRFWVCGAAFAGLLLVSVLLVSEPWQHGARIVRFALDLPLQRQAELATSLQTDALLSCILVGGTLALLAMVWRHGLSKNSTVALVIGLFVAEPLMQFWLSTRITSSENLAKSRIPDEIKKQFVPGQRWIVVAPFGQLNAPMMAGIDTLNGYEPFGSAPFFRYALAADDKSSFRADFQPKFMTPLWRVAGASHVLWKPKIKGKNLTGFKGTEVAKVGEWHLLQLEDGLRPWSRAYLAEQQIILPVEQVYANLKVEARSLFEFNRSVVLETPTGLPLRNSTFPSLVQSRLSTPDLLEWEIKPFSDTVFVHQSALAPGWRAYVDGKEKPILRANGFMGAVTVNSTSRRVAWVYDSQTLRFGIFLALCGLSFAASTAKIGRRKRAHASGKAHAPRSKI